MAQYNIKDSDLPVTCPFDNTHVVDNLTLVTHVNKCKKLPQNRGFVQCVFNACHFVRKAESKSHHANCPDRCRIEKDILNESLREEGSYFHGDCSLPEYKDHLIPDTEDWDAECDDSRGVYVFGDDLNKHFNTGNEAVMTRPRLHYAVVDDVENRDPVSVREAKTTAPLRLPKTLPMIHPEGSTIVGGRGRGLGTQQQVAQLQKTPPMTPRSDAVFGANGVGRGYGTPQKETHLQETSPMTQSSDAVRVGGCGLGRGYGTPQNVTQQLPEAPLMTQSPEAVGFGRGRGFCTLQQVAPLVGGGVKPVDSNGSFTSASNGIASDWSLTGQGKPMKIKGRGYGNRTVANFSSANSVGTSDEDTVSSMTSDRSGSRSSRMSDFCVPRLVNAPRRSDMNGKVGTKVNVGMFSTKPPAAMRGAFVDNTQQRSGATNGMLSFGLFGMGRGSGRARNVDIDLDSDEMSFDNMNGV